tara:strand:- start:530 stop:1135 length:606 start_codon:yes stop_codon:yes gene_type:complete
MANPMYGQNKFDDNLDTYSKYLDFCAGYSGHLSETAIDLTQAEGVAGVKGGDETLAEVDAATWVAGAHNTDARTAAAVTSSYLPAAVKGIHLAVEITGDQDEANAQSIHCNNTVGTGATSGNVFAKQVIGVLNGATASAVETAGTYDAPTSENLLWTPAATNPALGNGSVLHFYAIENGIWLVKVFAVPMGTGAVGVFTVS